MKSEQIIHSLAVGTKSIQSRVFDRETEEVISFVKIPIEDSGLVRCTHPVKEQDCYGDGNVYRGVRSKDSEVQTIYFNPVKEQLTDEEINLLAKAYSTMEGEINAPAFARAILRKAQKK